MIGAEEGLRRLENKLVVVLSEFDRSFHTVKYLRKVVIVWLSLRDILSGQQNQGQKGSFACAKGELGEMRARLVHVCVSTCIYTYIYISNCTETVYKLLLLPNNTTVKHFYTNWSGAKC